MPGILDSPVPSDFLLMLPDVVTIFAVAGFVGQVRGPAASGEPDIKGRWAEPGRPSAALATPTAATQSSRSRRTTTASRAGPTPITEMDAPLMVSSARTYSCARMGRSSNERAPEMSSSHPGSSS